MSSVPAELELGPGLAGTLVAPCRCRRRWLGLGCWRCRHPYNAWVGGPCRRRRGAINGGYFVYVGAIEDVEGIDH